MCKATKIQVNFWMILHAKASETRNRNVIQEALTDLHEKLMRINNTGRVTTRKMISFKSGRRHIPKPVPV